MPRRLFQGLRTAGNAVLTPALFSYYTGHARSAWAGRAVDRRGGPLPWYTYPAIDLLAAKDLAARDVLEFGAGQSTMWWAGRARSIVSCEGDAGWYGELTSRVPGNASLHLTRDLPTVLRLLEGRRFDVIVIDGPDVVGLERAVCAEYAPGWLREGGAIVLDNSDGAWSPDGRFVIMDRFRSLGYQRVDLYGWSPGNIASGCTSIFFRGACFLFAGEEDPVKPYPLAQHE